MRIIEDNASYFLEGDGQRVPLSADDLNLLRKLNPMGRTVHMRRIATKRLKENPNDIDAGILMKFASLPAKRWALHFPEVPNLENLTKTEAHDPKQK